MPCSKRAVVKARQKVENFASLHGFGNSAQDVALATEEALKNVIQHACPADNNMHIDGEATPDSLIIEVADKGMGFDISELDADSHTPMEPHGRGIRLMKGLMDDVRITSDREGTVIRMEKKRR